MISKNLIKKVILEQKKINLKQEIVDREVKEKILKNLKNDLIIVITGIRRCGKSTILNYIRSSQKDKNYFLNFDDFRLSEFELINFEDLMECFLELFGKEKICYFDELQNISGFEKAIRTFFDEGKKIIITGSNSNLLSKELGTHLTGRNIKIEMFPFSFIEFLKFKKYEINEDDLILREGKSKLKKFFNEYMKNGGFAYFLKTKNYDYLKNLYEDILYKDIIVRYNLLDEKNIKLLSYYLASNISKEISFNKLKNMLNLSNPTTIKNYINYLENSYLFFTINKFDYSLKKQIYNNKKVYFCDMGLLGVVSFKFSEDFGRQLENLVFLHYKRKSIYEIFYHRKKFECDFLLKEKDKIVKAIQVTKSLNYENEKREVMGLVEAVKEYGLKEGLLLTYEDEEREFTKDKIKIKVRQIWKYLVEN